MVSRLPSFTMDMRILSLRKYTAYPTAERRETRTRSAIDGEPTPRLAVTATQSVKGHSNLSGGADTQPTPLLSEVRGMHLVLTHSRLIPTKRPSQAHHKKEPGVAEGREPFQLGLSLQFERRTVGVELDSTNGATSGQV